MTRISPSAGQGLEPSSFLSIVLLLLANINFICEKDDDNLSDSSVLFVVNGTETLYIKKMTSVITHIAN